MHGLKNIKNTSLYFSSFIPP